MPPMTYLNDCAGKFKCPLKDDAGKTVATLLWGDALFELAREGAGSAERVKVRARAHTGWLPAANVAEGPGLLELYIIDVGQGDGVLMRTPHDGAWHLIDAGVRAAEQMTKKGAANFLRWKFTKELQRPAVELANVIVTHPDADHFGGVIDVLSGTLPDVTTVPGPAFAVQVQNFWHCGMGRFKGVAPLGAVRADTSLTPFPNATAGNAAPKAQASFITELLNGKGQFKTPARPFTGSANAGYAALAQWVGKVPKKVARLQHTQGWLPGYEPAAEGDADAGAGRTTIRVLGPVVEKLQGGGVGLRVLGGESITRNGHSVVLRVDHGAARILLTGDLNTASQRLLLALHGAEELAADVAKGCHHGSDDIDLNFVRAMAARATVVSSGDNEDYAHPRPRVLGASARYGREALTPKGELLPPLLYSTELARSVNLQYAGQVRTRPPAPVQSFAPDGVEGRFERNGQGYYKRLSWVPMATDLVYGLVNVRTDGQRILMAYMSEGSSDFDLQVFQAGRSPP